jgi:glycosyltransferase involved in cell wall biosynthesis
MSAEFFFRNWFIRPLKAIDGVVFVSRFSYEQHLKALPTLAQKQTLVAHNAIEALPESAISHQMGSYYLYFGRLSHEKGLVTLINAFNALPDLRLKIVGEGPMESSLREIAGANIEFCGYQSGDTLRTTIRDSKAIVVPSEWYENNPMTIIEASMAGVPTIGARIGGIPEIIVEGKTGYIFTSKSASELTEAVSKLESLTPEQYQTMSLECRKFADEKFSSRALYDKIIKFYTSILESYES